MDGPANSGSVDADASELSRSSAWPPTAEGPMAMGTRRRFRRPHWRHLRGLRLEIQVAAGTVIFRPSGRSAFGCVPTGSRG